MLQSIVKQQAKPNLKRCCYESLCEKKNPIGYKQIILSGRNLSSSIKMFQSNADGSTMGFQLLHLSKLHHSATNVPQSLMCKI